MNTRKSKVIQAAGAALLLALASVAQAAELKVIAGAAVAPALKALGPQFERATGHTLHVEYGILGELKSRIARGEKFDVAIVPAGLLEAAARNGKVDGATQAGLARVGMAVAVRAGAPKPDIGSSEAFKQALLGASHIAYPPEGAIGVHLTKVLALLGISDEMKAKTLAQKTVQTVAPTLAAGQADLGFAPSTVFAGASGIEVVGPFPPELQETLELSAGVGMASVAPEAAQALIRHLTSPEALAVFKAKGFEPVPGR